MEFVEHLQVDDETMYTLTASCEYSVNMLRFGCMLPLPTAYDLTPHRIASCRTDLCARVSRKCKLPTDWIVTIPQARYQGGSAEGVGVQAAKDTQEDSVGDFHHFLGLAVMSDQPPGTIPDDPARLQVGYTCLAQSRAPFIPVHPAPPPIHIPRAQARPAIAHITAHNTPA